MIYTDLDTEVVFCDIDGTISDDRHRADVLQANTPSSAFVSQWLPELFDKYHSGLTDDPAYYQVVRFLLQTEHPRRVIFITARTEKWRAKTEQWLMVHCPLIWDHRETNLYMRGNGDARLNVTVKAEHIREYLEAHGLTQEAAKIIIDNDERVLRSLGLLYPKAKLLQAINGKLVDWKNNPSPTDQPETADERPQPATVDEALRRLADIYLDRSKLYGDNYKKFGALMLALQNFVPGGKFPTETVDDWNRLGLLVLKAVKLSRYCANYKDGGHSDSLDDEAVYTQMLNEIDRGIRPGKDK